MLGGWQDFAALSLVAVAAAYLVRRWVGRRSPCSGCAASRCTGTREANPLVSLQPPPANFPAGKPPH